MAHEQVGRFARVPVGGRLIGARQLSTVHERPFVVGMGGQSGLPLSGQQQVGDAESYLGEHLGRHPAVAVLGQPLILPVVPPWLAVDLEALLRQIEDPDLADAMARV
jgi:hypothetical protein